MSVAVTWWGHASATVETGSARVAVDPLLADRLFHLVRHTPPPPPTAVDADLVLVSHLHNDHCHVPSLARFAPDVPVLVPRGGERYVARLGRERIVPVAPGDVVERAGVRIEVLAASHDGRRHPLAREQVPALGFRVSDREDTWWYPGDTELRDDMADAGAGGPRARPDRRLGTHSRRRPHAPRARRRGRPAGSARGGRCRCTGARSGRSGCSGSRAPTTTGSSPRPGARFAEALAASATEAVVVVPGERVIR